MRLWPKQAVLPLEGSRQVAFGAMVAAAIAAALGSTGCGDAGGAASLDNYRSRLSRPLEESIAEASYSAPARPPRSEALQLPLPRSGLDGLDFLRLRGCALQNTVAKRNSSLGRVAPPSQRLLLELEFLENAPACIHLQREKDNGELAEILEQAYELKKAQLPARIFNATLASAEYRDFWRPPAQLGLYPQNTGSAVITALESITRSALRWLSGNYRADGAAFELALSEVSKGDGGELLIALGLQAASLKAADTAIDKRLTQGDICVGGRVPEAAPILRTVVQKFFVGEVQLWSAALNQRYHQLIDPIRTLEDALRTTLPAQYKGWMQQRDAELAASRQAPSTHVRRLQALLGPCYPEFSREPEGSENTVDEV